MVKSELLERFAYKLSQLTPKDARIGAALILQAIAGALAEGRRIELRGFGSFIVQVRPARLGRNPLIGVSVRIPEKQIIRFRPAREMEVRVNAGSSSSAGGKIMK